MFGPVILLHAEDYLLELKENSLRTGFNYLIDNSVNLDYNFIFFFMY